MCSSYVVTCCVTERAIDSSRCTIDHYCAISWANDKKTPDALFTTTRFFVCLFFCFFVFFTTLAALSAGNENTGRKGNLRVVAPERKSSSVHESSFRFPGPVISGAFFRRFSFRIYISRPVPNNVSSLHRLLIVFLSPLLLLFLLRSRNNSVVLTRRIELQQHGLVLLCGVASRHRVQALISCSMWI